MEIDYTSLTTLLRLNGLTVKSSPDDIRALLLKANYTPDEASAALRILTQDQVPAPTEPGMPPAAHAQSSQAVASAQQAQSQAYAAAGYAPAPAALSTATLLPSIGTMWREGIRLGMNRLVPVVGIGLIAGVWTYVTGLVGKIPGGTSVTGATALFTHSSLLSLVPVGAIFAITYVIVWPILSLAVLHLLKGTTERVGIFTALGHAVRQAWSVIVLSILQFLIGVGAIGIITLPAYALYTMHRVPTLPLVGVAGLLLLIVLVLISRWFVFAYWVIADQQVGPLRALARSRAYGKKTWRWLGVSLALGFTVGIALIVVMGLITFIASYFLPHAVSAPLLAILNPVSTFVSLAFFQAAILSLYGILKGNTPTEGARSRNLVILAIVGLLAITPIAYVAVNVFKDIITPHYKPETALELRVEFLRYELEAQKKEKGTYPASLGELYAGMQAPPDMNSLTYTPSTDRLHYTLCATASGAQTCKKDTDLGFGGQPIGK